MTDTPRPWIRRWPNQVAIILLLLVAWTIAAQRWQDKDCSTGTSYGLVVSHFGTPDHFEGCDEYGDYTDDYNG